LLAVRDEQPDRIIRPSTGLAVLDVAVVVAAAASYEHGYDLGRAGADYSSAESP
jgi:hypothetical protein